MFHNICTMFRYLVVATEVAKGGKVYKYHLCTEHSLIDIYYITYNKFSVVSVGN